MHTSIYQQYSGIRAFRAAADKTADFVFLSSSSRASDRSELKLSFQRIDWFLEFGVCSNSVKLERCRPLGRRSPLRTNKKLNSPMTTIGRRTAILRYWATWTVCPRILGGCKSNELSSFSLSRTMWPNKSNGGVQRPWRDLGVLWRMWSKCQIAFDYCNRFSMTNDDSSPCFDSKCFHFITNLQNNYFDFQ